MSKAVSSSAQVDIARSLLPAGPGLLAVGKLLHLHGVHGEILMEIYTDFPERLVPGIVLYVGTSGESLRLTHQRSHKGGLLMTFEGYATPEAVGQLRNQILFVHADDRPPLVEGEYYHHQLLNLKVTSDAGQSLGVVSGIIETGASDVLVVQPELGPEVLIPIVDSFVQKVDLNSGEIIVHLIPGMLSEDS